jgi:TonB family protein
MAMDDSLVYRKSGRGAAQLAMDHGRTLTPRERHVLILLDGRRTIGELSDLLGPETVQRLLPELEAKGFAKRIDPTLGAEWADAITQFHGGLPSGEPSRAARSQRLNAPAWIALVIVLSIGAGYWAVNRHYRAQTDAAWRLDHTLAQVLPIHVYGASTSTDAFVSTEPEGPVTIAPIAPLHEVPVSQSAEAASSAHAAPKAAAGDHQAIVRTESAGASPAHARAPATRSPPTADSAEPSAAPPALPAALAIAAPAPVRAAAPPRSAPETEVAMEAPAAQPANAPVTLRPLRHDPPQFPERALRDGIGESQARVRLWVTPEGKVDQVDIIEATPPGVFDDEVRRALSLWTFEPPGRPMEKVFDLTLKP